MHAMCGGKISGCNGVIELRGLLGEHVLLGIGCERVPELWGRHFPGCSERGELRGVHHRHVFGVGRDFVHELLSGQVCSCFGFGAVHCVRRWTVFCEHGGVGIGDLLELHGGDILVAGSERLFKLFARKICNEHRYGCLCELSSRHVFVIWGVDVYPVPRRHVSRRHWKHGVFRLRCGLVCKCNRRLSLVHLFHLCCWLLLVRRNERLLELRSWLVCCELCLHWVHDVCGWFVLVHGCKCVRRLFRRHISEQHGVGDLFTVPFGHFSRNEWFIGVDIMFQMRLGDVFGQRLELMFSLRCRFLRTELGLRGMRKLCSREFPKWDRFVDVCCVHSRAVLVVFGRSRVVDVRELRERAICNRGSCALLVVHSRSLFRHHWWYAVFKLRSRQIFGVGCSERVFGLHRGNQSARIGKFKLSCVRCGHVLFHRRRPLLELRRRNLHVQWRRTKLQPLRVWLVLGDCGGPDIAALLELPGREVLYSKFINLRGMFRWPVRKWDWRDNVHGLRLGHVHGLWRHGMQGLCRR
jgi:hypothetical protein